MHQNPGISTNCNQPAPIAPRIHPRSRNACTIFCNSVQFRGLGQDCRFDAILFRLARQDSGLRQNALGKARAGPLLQSIPAEIDTTKLDCNWIAKLQRIAILLVGLHQNCTDYRGIETSNPSKLLDNHAIPVHIRIAWIPQPAPITNHNPNTILNRQAILGQSKNPIAMGERKRPEYIEPGAGSRTGLALQLR